jgi:hypothetical protein
MFDVGAIRGSMNDWSQAITPALQFPFGGGTSDEESGRVKVRNSLTEITKEVLSKEKCKKYLEELLKQIKATMTVDTLIDKSVSAVSDIANNNLTFDGPSSTVLLTADAFLESNAAGANTVGAWFSQNPGTIGLSQFNGNSIFLRLADWNGRGSSFFNLIDGQMNAYGYGTLMHELLHKKHLGGFSHSQMDSAAQRGGVYSAPLYKNAQSASIGTACFSS